MSSKIIVMQSFITCCSPDTPLHCLLRSRVCSLAMPHRYQSPSSSNRLYIKTTTKHTSSFDSHLSEYMSGDVALTCTHLYQSLIKLSDEVLRRRFMHWLFLAPIANASVSDQKNMRTFIRLRPIV